MAKTRNIRKQDPEKIIDTLSKSTKKESKESTSSITLGTQFAYAKSPSKKGRDKPARYSASDLRSLADANPIVKVCINKIKHQMTKVDYIVRAIDPKEHDDLQDQINYVKNILKYPNGNDDTYRTLFSKIVEDVLVLDQGYVEKVRNAKGYVTELYQVDGATMKPNIDEFGLLKSPAFVQYVQFGKTEPDAEFEETDIMRFMLNPSGQTGKIGYGMSPVESIVGTVVASIQAALYNNSYFDDSKVPPAIINLPNVNKEEILAFKAGFEAQLAGKPWSNAYTNADGAIDIKLLRPSNQEMQFYELNLWLARIVFAAFELSPQDVGFTMDINKATATVEERITKNGGISNMMDVVKEEINADLIGDLAEYDEKFSRIEFAFDDQDKLDELSQSQTDQTYINAGVLTPNEVRIRMGLDPLEEEVKPEPIAPVADITQEDAKSDEPAKEDLKQEGPVKTFKNLDKWLKHYQ